MTATAETIYAGEWLKWMCNREYCLKSDVITADAITGTALKSGTSMSGAAGSKAVCTSGPATAWLVEPVTAAELVAGCTKLMLVRGPAIIDSDTMVLGDASDITVDALALNIIAVNSGLCTWTTQTT